MALIVWYMGSTASIFRINMSKVENLVGCIRDEKLVMDTGLTNQEARWGTKDGNYLPDYNTVL